MLGRDANAGVAHADRDVWSHVAAVARAYCGGRIAADWSRSLGIGRAQAYREEAVGSVAEFAAAGRKIVDVEGISIGVFHVDGQWHALQNSCLHRGGPVCNGSLENGILTCPWHDSCFNVTDGAVLKGPATEPLKTYRVVVDGDVGRVEG